MDFVDETANSLAWPSKTSRIAFVSAIYRGALTSRGVDVVDAGGLDVCAGERLPHHLDYAHRLRTGAAMWYASFEAP